jgi:ferredoxin-NADP reductase
MATAPRPDQLLEFHVRAQGRGGLSDILVTDTRDGDTLRLGAPQGSAELNPMSDRGVLLVTNDSDRLPGGVPPVDVNPGGLDAFLTGPPDLIHASEGRLTAAGVPDACIHTDSWLNA